VNNNMLIGTWTLSNFTIEDEDGLRPWGKDMRGLLIYADTGHVSVSINKAIQNDGENESENILDSILFYSGTFRVAGTTVIHNVSVASAPTRVGKEMVRQATLTGDELTLVTPEGYSPKATLVWLRVSK
jgi:hypothetical protein